MKALIAYYSFTGKTKSLCERLKTNECDLYEIVEYGKKGFMQAFLGCFKSLRGVPSKIEPVTVDLSAYDLIIVASPVWAGGIAPAAISFLFSEGIKGKDVIIIANAGGEQDVVKRIQPIVSKAGVNCIKIYNTKNGADIEIVELSQ